MPEPEQELSSKFHPLPCLFTIGSLFCGYYSILAAIKGDFVIAAIAILVAGIFDGLDGRIARLTGTTSMFGVELDSLCDMVSFGVAPGLLAYYWALQPYGRYGWMAGFLYMATTCLRLARFNSQKVSSKHFVGLPCPAAAAMVSSTVLFCEYLGLDKMVITQISLLVQVYLLSYLMVSTHLYFSFKKPPALTKTRTFQLLVGVLLLFVMIASEPQIMLFAVCGLYVLSGITIALYRRISKLGRLKNSGDQELPKQNSI